LLMGDSHANHLHPALRALFKNTNISQATSSGCRPLLNAPGDKVCVDFREKLFKEFLPGHHFDAIIVSGRWRDGEANYLVDTIKALEPYADKIVVSGPIIEYHASLPKVLAISIQRN